MVSIHACLGHLNLHHSQSTSWLSPHIRSNTLRVSLSCFDSLWHGCRHHMQRAYWPIPNHRHRMHFATDSFLSRPFHGCRHHSESTKRLNHGVHTDRLSATESTLHRLWNG